MNKKTSLKKKNSYFIKREVHKSDKTRPTRKCCCLNSTESSVKFPFSTRVPVERIEHWDDEDATLGQGEVAGDGEIGVPNGKFKAMKCSWLHIMRRKSNLRDMRKVLSGKEDILAAICLQYACKKNNVIKIISWS